MASQAVSGIYEIVNTRNQKRYVGSSVDVGSRWRGHRHDLNQGKHHSRALQRAWRKYGETAFQFRLLRECPRSLLIQLEQEHIDRLRPEYNCCQIAGSSLGMKRSAESRAKQSASRKGMKLTAEHRAAIGAAHRGKPKTPEAIAKTRAARLGMKLSPISDAHKAAISAANRGRKPSAKQIEAIRKANTGRPRPDMIGNDWGRYEWTPEQRAANGARHRGRKCSEESKARMRAGWEARKAARS